MKSFNSNTLVESLQDDVRQIILRANKLEHLPVELLQQQPAPDKWSVAQVLEHLCIYSRYYLTAIESKLHRSQSGPGNIFTPGWLGNYFTRIMKPTGDHTISKKMKAPKNALPSAQPDAGEVLKEFILHQHHLLNLLAIAKTANLNHIRIPTSLNKFITLKLGDTFRFFIAHEQRHFIQTDNILREIQTNQNNFLYFSSTHFNEPLEAMPNHR